MTALAAFIDEDGIAYLASDGLVVRRDGTRLDEYGVKTARINDSICVGFSGDVRYGNQLLAHLFQRGELAQLEENIDLCALFEIHGITVPNGTYEEARDWLSWQLTAWREAWTRQGEEIPNLNVALVGISDHGPRFSVWHCVHDWEIEQCGIWQPGCISGYPLGPIPDEGAKDALHNTAKLPVNRLRDCIRVFAAKKPDAVNRNVLIRSSDSRFVVNRDKWPLPTAMEWPAIPPAGAPSSSPAQA